MVQTSTSPRLSGTSTVTPIYRCDIRYIHLTATPAVAKLKATLRTPCVVHTQSIPSKELFRRTQEFMKTVHSANRTRQIPIITRGRSQEGHHAELHCLDEKTKAALRTTAWRHGSERLWPKLEDGRKQTLSDMLPSRTVQKHLSIYTSGLLPQSSFSLTVDLRQCQGRVQSQQVSSMWRVEDTVLDAHMTGERAASSKPTGDRWESSKTPHSPLRGHIYTENKLLTQMSWWCLG